MIGFVAKIREGNYLMFKLKCESCGEEFLSRNLKSKFCKKYESCILAKHEYLKKIDRERMKKKYSYRLECKNARKDKIKGVSKSSFCLCCGNEFISYGKFNKLCEKCKERHSRYNGLCEGDFSGGIFRKKILGA
jgi:hypothetical protein